MPQHYQGKLTQVQELHFSSCDPQVSIHLRNWQQVLNYYSKAEATPEVVTCFCSLSASSIPPIPVPPHPTPSLSLPSHPISLPPISPPLCSSQGTQPGSAATANQQEIACRLKCSAGLAELENRKYKNAARLFLQANFDDCKCPDVSRIPNFLSLSNLSLSSVYLTAAVSPYCGSVRRAVCSGLIRQTRPLH